MKTLYYLDNEEDIGLKNVLFCYSRLSRQNQLMFETTHHFFRMTENFVTLIDNMDNEQKRGSTRFIMDALQPILPFSSWWPTEFAKKGEYTGAALAYWMISKHRIPSSSICIFSVYPEDCPEASEGMDIVKALTEDLDQPGVNWIQKSQVKRLLKQLNDWCDCDSGGS